MAAEPLARALIFVFSSFSWMNESGQNKMAPSFAEPSIRVFAIWAEVPWPVGASSGGEGGGGRDGSVDDGVDGTEWLGHKWL